MEAKISCVSDGRSGEPTSFSGICLLRQEVYFQLCPDCCPLTERSKSWHWTTQCEAAFAALKDKFLSLPILSFPQFDKTFVVGTYGC